MIFILDKMLLRAEMLNETEIGIKSYLILCQHVILFEVTTFTIKLEQKKKREVNCNFKKFNKIMI